MELWQIAILALLAAGAATVAAVILLATGQFGQARKIQKAYDEARKSPVLLCEPSAKFLGLGSGADAPVGNGVLLLSENELYFERFHPQASWSLSLERILKLERPGSFLSSTRPGRRFFVLVFHDDQGRAERAGFRVVDVDRWILDSGTEARKLKGFGIGRTS